MRATFYGFEIVKKGIQSAQTGLDITGQNMAKMNNSEYSRQIVEQSAIHFNSSSYKYALLTTENSGQGVSVDRIAQVRDSFLDVQVRVANSSNAAVAKETVILDQINNIFDETLKDGLGAMYEEFYERLQTLSSHTGDIEFSELVRSSAQKITETLGYYHNQLETIDSQQRQDLAISVDDVNSYISKINTLNKTIQNETLQGNVSNDLLDTRNAYLDKLSGQLDITVTQHADGRVSVMSGSVSLIDPSNLYTAELSLDDSSGELKLVNEKGETVDVSGGEIFGFFETLNGKGAYASGGENDFYGIPYYQNALDSFASKFAETMNTLNGTGKPLFIGDTASTIDISDEWLADGNYITTTNDADGKPGKNDNIMNMIRTLDTATQITTGYKGTFDGFAGSLMGKIATDVDYYGDMADNAAIVLNSLENQRDSIKGVVLNEETVNLMKYQRAFEASSRVMTTLDEMLDTIINRMGTVGR